MNAGAVVAASVVGVFLVAALVAMVVAALGSMRDLEEKTVDAAAIATGAAQVAEGAAVQSVRAAAASEVLSELQIGQNATIRNEKSKRRNSRRSRRRASRK